MSTRSVFEMRTWVLGLAAGVAGGVCLVQCALGLMAEDRIVSKDLERSWLEFRGAEACPLPKPSLADNDGRVTVLDWHEGRPSMPRLVASVVGECRWGVGCAAGARVMNVHVQMGEIDPWQRSTRQLSSEDEVTP